MRKFSVLLILIFVATISYAGGKVSTSAGSSKSTYVPRSDEAVPGGLRPSGANHIGTETLPNGDKVYQYSNGTNVTVDPKGIGMTSKTFENTGGPRLEDGAPDVHVAGSSGPTDMTGFKAAPSTARPWDPVPKSDFDRSLETSDPTRDLGTFSTKGAGGEAAPAPGPGPAPTVQKTSTGNSAGGEYDAKYDDGSSAAQGVATKEANAKLTAGAKPSETGTHIPSCDMFYDPSGAGEPYIAPSQNLVSAACTPLLTTDKACLGQFETTKMICHTEENENIASSVTMIQTLMSVASGVTNACSNFGKAMDIAKKAMAAYTTACGALQVMCNSKCGTAVLSLNKFQAAIAKAKTLLTANCTKAAAASKANNISSNGAVPDNSPQIQAKCASYHTTLDRGAAIAKSDSVAEQPHTIYGKQKICKVSVVALLGTAIINIGTFAQSKAQADQCKKDSESEEQKKIAEASCENVANRSRADCACTLEANKKISYCITELAARPVDCALAENSDKPICICRANPRMTGCEGVSTAMTTNSTLSTGNGGALGSGRGPSNAQVAGLGGAAADGSGGFSVKGGNGTDGSSASGGGGGGASSAGLSDSGASGSGSNKAAAASDAGKLSANILDSGAGGGGAGGRFGSGSDYNSPEYRSRLKSFAAKNGIGAKIAGSNWTDQVTGMGGKSNFDKIKARYQENKASLLNK